VGGVGFAATPLPTPPARLSKHPTSNYQFVSLGPGVKLTSKAISAINVKIVVPAEIIKKSSDTTKPFKTSLPDSRHA
jgi:hypothetical protein